MCQVLGSPLSPSVQGLLAGCWRRSVDANIDWELVPVRSCLARCSVFSGVTLVVVGPFLLEEVTTTGVCGCRTPRGLFGVGVSCGW